ncbi:MAG TPA: hypothetical protein EYM25_05235 [Deltaproteobacteria bacterium]|nr:hypothetical protein [Deltaproteobacteria bacterium]
MVQSRPQNFSLLQRLVIGFPRTVTIVALLLTLAVLPLLPTLEKDPSPHLLPRTHESRVAMERLREDYSGTYPAIFMMLEAENSVFTPATLARVQALTEALEIIDLLDEEARAAFLKFSESLPESAGSQLREALSTPEMLDFDVLGEIQEELEQAGNWTPEIAEGFRNLEAKLMPIREVTSLANTDTILGRDGDLSIEPVLEDVPESSEDAQAIQARVAENELFRNVLHSPDGRRTGLVIETMMDEEDTENLNALYHAIQQVVAAHPGPEHVYIAGLSVGTSALKKAIDVDTARLFPVVSVFALVCLWLVFRGITGMLVPMLVVLCAIALTMGVMVLLDFPMNIVTSALPVFLISIGVADGIHIYSDYRDHRLAGKPREEAVRLMLERMTMPVVMTSVTTAIGFLALAVTEIVPIRTFGVFVAVGTMLAMLYSLLFIPALLLILPEQKTPQARSRSRVDQWILRLLEAITKQVQRSSGKVLLVSGVVFVLAVVGTTRIVVESSIEQNFRSGHPLVKATEAVKRLAGSRNLNLLIEAPGEAEPWKRPEFLQALMQFQSAVESDPVVGRILSLGDLVERIHYVINESNPEFRRIPNPEESIAGEVVSGRNLVAQLLLLYENAGGDVLSDVVNDDYTQLNVVVTIRSTSTPVLEAIVARIQEHARTQLAPAGLRMQIIGDVMTSLATSMETIKGQIRSLLLSAGVVLLLLFGVFRSIRLGLFGIVPLLFTVTLNFGLMGLLGLPLDIGTAVVSSIVIGIGVDFSIHYLASLRRQLRVGDSIPEAMRHTVLHTGKAITANALTVGIGFLALCFASFLPLVTMGILVCLTLIFSALATLVLVPALILTFGMDRPLQSATAPHLPTA